MEHSAIDLKLLQIVKKSREDMDSRLPHWARRSNPIVRLHLGRHWKTILPELGFIVKAVAVQIMLVALTLPLPVLFDLALPMITASVLLFPIALYLYVTMLFGVGLAAVDNIVHDIHNGALELVRLTPFTLPRILASKAAAALWRQVENLGLLLTAVSLFSLPLLISQYAMLWPLNQHPYVARSAMILGLLVSVLRLTLEPFMVGMLGIVMGALLPSRSYAALSTAFLGFFYFLLINLPRLVAMPWPLRFAVEFVLPVMLPLLIILAAFRFTAYIITTRQ